MIRKLLGLVFNRWVLTAVLLLAISGVIWFIGPLVAIADRRPLESENARWIAIASIVGLGVLILAWQAWRARRGNAKVVQQLLTPAPGADKGAPESADLAAVRERFERALLTLRRARFGSGGVLQGWRAKFGGRYLYELPWYLIIGAPGSGKTTALHHCGLKFPLAEAVGDHAVRGIGGTRHCDWWFTDRAVLIDTAGRFTTQDSDRANDRSTWSGFLAMLQRARPRQPINGVLVTVSVSDLLTRSAAERVQHAATVRARVQELHQDLRIRFPIYLLVTKCDLLAGFTDYFSTLDKDQRAAPWGFSFALDAKNDSSLAAFGTEFDALQQRLTDGLIDRLQTDRDPQRRARIYGFPGQFANLRSVLQEFSEAVFSPSPYEANPLLRGVYCISGTQEGTPIDRVLGSIARAYRIERAVIAPNQSSGRSFFLTRLLGEVVFTESGLAGTNLAWERRRALLAIGGYAAVALLTIGAVSAWGLSYLNNRRYVADVAARVDEVRKLVQVTPNRNSPDLLPILPALDATRHLATPTIGGGDSVPWSLGFGLFQGQKLDSAARTAYEHMLVDAVQPRLALRVQERLRLSSDAPESQYEALKAYLMLYDAQRFDPVALKKYIEDDWDARLRAELTTEQRAQLSRHLDALLAQGAVVSPLPQDLALVKSTRAQLASTSLAQRIYNRMRHQGLGSEYPEFTIAAKAGGSAPLVFRRVSGQPLTSGVPGLYTYDGYHQGFQNAVGAVAKQLADEQGWVLGVTEPPRDPAAVLSGADAVTDDVRRIYLTEYANLWDAFIKDIRIVPLTSQSQAVQTAQLLSGPGSPLPRLMKALSRETTLGKDSSGGVIDSVTDRAASAIDSLRRKIPGQRPGAKIESIVDDRFTDLRLFATAPEGGKTPVDDAVALIGEVYVQLNADETASKGGVPPPPSPVANKAKSAAAQMPEPVRSLVSDLAGNSARLSSTVLRQTLSAEVRSQVGEFCTQALAGRYPIDRDSSRDATQADFAMVFGPGGKIDHVFQDKLNPYVDTSTRPWRFRPVDGTPLGSDVGTLPQFQRAATIRDTLFGGGGQGASMKLEFKPVEMDPSLTQFTIDVDGQIVKYAHGPQIPTTVQWPGPRGSSQVRVEISPPSANLSSMVTSGPWALFRLFDRVKIDNGSAPEKFRATFDIDGKKAVFDVTTSSVRNPFRLPELQQFNCPMGL